MRLALNMVSLHGGGGGRIAAHFLRHVATQTRHDCLVALPDGRVPEVVAEHPERFQVTTGPTGWHAFATRIHFDNVHWPALMRREGTAALFSLTNLSTLRPSVPHLLLFHHAHFVYPDSPAFGRMERRERARREVQAALFRETLRGVQAVVVQTPVMRDRLLGVFGQVLRDRPIHVLPNSAFPMGSLTAVGARARGAWAPPPPGDALWLAPTQYYPHKNLELLVAVGRVLMNRGVRDVKIGLMVEPEDHPGAAAFLARVRAPDLAPAFSLLGRQPAEAMPDLYARSIGVLNPSWLEAQSFGYLEAMALGRPVLASDFDFARVACGDAATYLPPEDPGAWADALVHLSRSPAAWALRSGLGRVRFAECEAEAQATFPRYLEILESLAAEARAA